MHAMFITKFAEDEKHNGELVELLRESEYMWLVKFEDGTIKEVYKTELF